MLEGSCRSALLAPLLRDPGLLADDAAIAILSDTDSKPALTYLRERISALDGPIAVSAARVLVRHARPLAITECVRLARCGVTDVAEQAVRTLAGIKGPKAQLAMEGLLDLYREPWLEPLVERLSRRVSATTSERMREVVKRADPRRPGALLVLHRAGIVDAGHSLAAVALVKRRHRDRIWAASVLSVDPRYAAKARDALTEAAASEVESESQEALKALLDHAPELAVSRLIKRLHSTRDGGLRLEIVEMLSTTTSRDARDAIAGALNDLDRRVVRRAANNLLSVDYKFEIEPTIEAMLGGRLDIDSGLAALLTSERKACQHHAQRLLRRKTLPARRLGARILALDPDTRASQHAVKLVDDSDPTVRCAAIWTLIRTSQDFDLLYSAIGRLLDDWQPIDGPPLFEADKASAFHPVSCCADAIYQMLGNPPSLSYAPLEHRDTADTQELQLSAAEIARELGLTA
jgi:HEAT repeat protein